jgi:hypothetical protein
MKRIFIFAAIGLVTLTVTGYALELQPTPVQDMMRLSLAQTNSTPFNSDQTTVDTAKGKEQAGQKGSSGGKKSLLQAGLWSALVPGGGEFYLGHKHKARYFFATEALTWVGYISFRTWGHWKKNDYVRFADQEAGAHLDGKSDEFADFVGFYTDITDYNTLGRVSDPERPYLYDTPDNHWRWQSTADQMNYRTIKNQSREAYRRAKFMIGIAVISRIVSIVDAVLLTRRANQADESVFSERDVKPYEFRVDPLSSNKQVCLVIHTGW